MRGSVDFPCKPQQHRWMQGTSHSCACGKMRQAVVPPYGLICYARKVVYLWYGHQDIRVTWYSSKVRIKGTSKIGASKKGTTKKGTLRKGPLRGGPLREVRVRKVPVRKIRLIKVQLKKVPAPTSDTVRYVLK